MMSISLSIMIIASRVSTSTRLRGIIIKPDLNGSDCFLKI